MILLLNLVFIFACLLLIAVVLIQEGKGGGLGGAFGGAGQQTFGVGTSGITHFTAIICVVVLSSAIFIHLLGERTSDSRVGDDFGPSLITPSTAEGNAPAESSETP